MYATDGDDMLGGSDLDFCLFNLIKDRIFNATGYQLPAKDGGFDATVTRNQEDFNKKQQHPTLLCTNANTRTQTEDIKKRLSYEQSVVFHCEIPPPPSSSPAAIDAHASNTPVDFAVSRTDFEEGCESLFARGMAPVERLLLELGENL